MNPCRVVNTDMVSGFQMQVYTEMLNVPVLTRIFKVPSFFVDEHWLILGYVFCLACVIMTKKNNHMEPRTLIDEKVSSKVVTHHCQGKKLLLTLTSC